MDYEKNFHQIPSDFIHFRAKWLGGKNQGRRVMSFSFDVPESFNKRLSQIILSKENEMIRSFEPAPGPPQNLYLTARWKKYNILTWDHPECFFLRQMIREGVKKFSGSSGIQKNFRYIQCWANILRKGDSFDIHAHGPPGEVISGTYYTDVGSSKGNSGAIFFDMTGKKENTFVRLTPRNGHMNLFKGNISHFVSKYNGDTPRISIAWDIMPVPVKGNSFVRF
jgi:hypothetical protein